MIWCRCVTLDPTPVTQINDENSCEKPQLWPPGMHPQHVGSRAGFKLWPLHSAWSELCLGTDLALQTWSKTCFIARDFYNDHWYPSPNLQVLWSEPAGCKVLSLPGMLSPLAPSSPGPEEQLTFTAPQHGHTLGKVLSKNNSPNLINFPSYIEEWWMCNSYSHNLPSSRCGTFWSSNMNLQGYLLQKPLLELPFCLKLLL